MRHTLAFLIFSFFIALQADGSDIEVMVPDTNETGFFENAAVPAKLLAAKHELNDHNLRGALTIYREVLNIEPKNATALYWTARCHYGLKKYGLAKEYLDKAVEADPKIYSDIFLFYGRIHHRLAELDQAIESYNSFLTSGGNKSSFDIEEAQRFIKECEYAKLMMANPVDVSIENMGNVVNTRFDEYAPAVTADGKMLLFTSRRSESVGGEIDEGGDFKFYEDIYFTRISEKSGEWTLSRGVEGEVNTPTYDAVLSVAPDGSHMYVYRNNANSAGDIFKSTYSRADDEWRAPEKMPKPINTSYFESSVSITADGNTLYFISERPEGYGQGDIYVSTRSGNNWGKPKNVGDVINTYLDEKFVFIHPNGKMLYFASDGHKCLGSYDIFRSEFVNGQWGVPVNLGYPINTVNEESTFSLTSDNQTMYIAAEYGNSLGERDIYEINLSAYKAISSGYERSSFGTLILTVEDEKGRGIKGADIVIVTSETNVITEQETDKLGRARISLLGEVQYVAKITVDGETKEVLIDMTLNTSGETVIKETVKF